MLLWDPPKHESVRHDTFMENGKLENQWIKFIFIFNHVKYALMWQTSYEQLKLYVHVLLFLFSCIYGQFWTRSEAGF